MTDLSHVALNIDIIRNGIGEAAIRSGRRPEDVTLVAVTKTYAPEYVAAAAIAGVVHTGENRVQEAAPKIEALKLALPHSPLQWHLIGHLQSNKARLAVQLFDLIQTLDSIQLAARINRFAAEEGKIMPVLIQVNISEEESKSGFATDRVGDSITQILENCPSLIIKGFMTIAPFLGPEEVRPVFRKVRELRDTLSSTIVHPRYLPTELSMGMSGDYQVAIEEGSTMVRIGSAIFGKRN